MAGCPGEEDLKPWIWDLELFVAAFAANLNSHFILLCAQKSTCEMNAKKWKEKAKEKLLKLAT